MTFSYVGVGSNLGDRWSYLALARDRLGGGRASPVYETAPIGGPPQRPYLNGVLELRWEGSPAQLLERCHDIEREAARRRHVRWSPRTLDLDVIACGPHRLRQPGFDLPHPRALQRAFVVRPLLDLGPRRIPITADDLVRARRSTAAQPCRLVGPWP